MNAVAIASIFYALTFCHFIEKRIDLAAMLSAQDEVAGRYATRQVASRVIAIIKRSNFRRKFIYV